MKYICYNANPKNYKAGDCVVRSVCTALQQDWYKTLEDLYEIGKKKCRMPNDNLVYKAYLKEHGFYEMTSLKHSNGKKYTIEEVIDEYPNDILVINCTGHITVSIQGYLIDTWNCSNYCAGKFWRLPIKDKKKIKEYLDFLIENQIPQRVF